MRDSVVGAMCLQMNKRCAILMFAMVVIGASHAAISASPDDERVSGYLDEQGLDELLEVQLFDRLGREREITERIEIATRLGGLYLAELGREDLGEAGREAVLVKGQILIEILPAGTLLELRLELLVQQYKVHEQAADLSRIGLLSGTARAASVESLDLLVSEVSQVAKISGVEVEQLDRNAARSTGDRQAGFEEKLATARAIRSRANFFHGWSGYSKAVLNEHKIGSDVFKAFGWVLGFEGKLPSLKQVDTDLLEYDHVARAMLGVALSKMHNGDTREARLWLMAVEEADTTPEFAVNFAHQRMLEVYLEELDWISSERRAVYLREFKPESLLGIAQSRLLVLKTLETIGSRGSRSAGQGGSEGAVELARIGLERLIELGEIGHILDLQSRFGALPLLDSGFVSLYTQGLSELADGDADGGMASYAQASLKLSQALEASDVDRYSVHAGDAALKLAYCEMRQGRPGEAAVVLERYAGFISSETQREESAWLLILALDSAVQAGQGQLAERLSSQIGRYIRLYPSTERTNTLIIRYALSPHLEASEAVGSLVIDDPSDPLAVPARRKLIQLLYKHPELVEGDDSGQRLHEAIVEHSRWLWRNEPGEGVNVRDSRERLAVCRIVIATGLALDDPDRGFLDGVIDRCEGLIEKWPALDGALPELAFRRIQLLLIGGDVERAGEIALSSGVLEESVVPIALLMVYEAAWERYKIRPGVSYAQAVVRYGRGVIDVSVEQPSGGLDHRLSLVAEGMAEAAEYISDSTHDSSMREYAMAVSLRIYHEGAPSADGLARTAELGEEFGHADIALECWLRLVGQLNGTQELWHRARFESFRLLDGSDPEKAQLVYEQYQAMYPDGSPEPWGSQIRELFGDGSGGEP